MVAPGLGEHFLHEPLVVGIGKGFVAAHRIALVQRNRIVCVISVSRA